MTDGSKSNHTLDITETLSGTSTQDVHVPAQKPTLGLVLAGAFGLAGALIMAISTPFVMPALRKHCLPYVPATDNQLDNLLRAFKRHSKRGDMFLDIGSGDGRICRLAAQADIYSEVHGVELNYILVLKSRFNAIRENNHKIVKTFHRDLWQFPLSRYDSICIFGVESMMSPLETYLRNTNTKQQTIYCCRFPFGKSMNAIDEIGCGIDTIWVYRLPDNNQGEQTAVC